MPVPTNDVEALDLIRSMERFYKKAFSNFREDADYYEGNLETLVSLPDGFDLTIPTTGRAIVDEAIDAVLSDDIIVTYQPRGVTKTAELDADLVRRWCKQLWRSWRRKAADIDPIRDAGKNLFRSGFATLKLVPDPSLWPSLPEKDLADLKAADAANGTKSLAARVRAIKGLRERHMPLTPRSMSPLCIMVDPTIGFRKLWIIERYEAAGADIAALYEEFEDDFKAFTGDYGRHKIHEVWTATRATAAGKVIEGEHFIFIDEACVLQGPNPYQDLPYVVKYSGYGNETYEGDPEDKSVGFFTKQVKSLLKAEARRFSQFDAIMAQLAYPIGILPMEVDPDSFDTSPGAMNFVPDVVLQNADKIWLKAPIPGAEYLNSLKVIGAQIERGTTQSAVRGASVPGTDSAAQLGMTTGQALLKLDSVKRGLEDMVSELMSMSLFYVDTVLKGKVSAHGAETGTAKYTLGPDNIRGHYTVSVEFQPDEQQMKMRMLAVANDAIVKGGMSPYDALVFAGFDNPEEMIARRFAYDVMQEPLVKRALSREMLKEWGIDADKLEMEEKMEMGIDQVRLSEFMNMLQSGSIPGSGMAPGGGPPPPPQPGGQDPTAALAQGGAGPMTMPVGAPNQAPPLQAPQQIQQPMGAP